MAMGPENTTHCLSLACRRLSVAALPGLLVFPASFVGTEDSAGSDRGIMASLSFLHPPLLPPPAAQSLFCAGRGWLDRAEDPGGTLRARRTEAIGVCLCEEGVVPQSLPGP